MPKPAKKPTREDIVNRVATVVKSIGTILGVFGFFLALFPGLRFALTSVFSARYEVGIGAMHGSGLEKLVGDQFYSSVWSRNGLRRAENIFNVDGSIVVNTGGDPVPAYAPQTKQARAFISPGQCMYVHNLRFSFFKGDPTVSVGGVTEAELRAEDSANPAKALLRRLPAGFNAPGCDPNSTDPAKACGRAAVWANVTLVDCGSPK